MIISKSTPGFRVAKIRLLALRSHRDIVPRRDGESPAGRSGLSNRHTSMAGTSGRRRRVKPRTDRRPAWGPDHRVNAERILVIVTTYIDEAGTHGNAPHMIMGALVGRLGQWAYFDKKWRKMLRRNSIGYFHSKKLKHSDGPFKGWSRAQKMALIATASDIQQKTPFSG